MKNVIITGSTGLIGKLVLDKPLSKVYPNLGVTSTKLASKIVEVGLSGGNKIVYENKDIRN